MFGYISQTWIRWTKYGKNKIVLAFFLIYNQKSYKTIVKLSWSTIKLMDEKQGIDQD